MLCDARGGTIEHHSVTDPLGRSVSAALARFDDGTAVLESAAASGLHLLGADERDPLRASSLGTGELLVAAAPIMAGPRTVVRSSRAGGR